MSVILPWKYHVQSEDLPVDQNLALKGQLAFECIRYVSSCLVTCSYL